MLDVVTFRWKPAPGYRSKFGPETVNVLRRMVARHYADPHRFVCVTDLSDGLDTEVEVLKPWNDFVAVPHPHGPKHPSCYRRLRAFAPDIAATLGERFVSIDLDCVITGDLRPLWNRPEEFVIWGDTNPKSFYNGSMFLLRAGARRQVWDRFDPVASPREAHAAGRFGSDQGWISHCLGGGEARWTRADGVYSFRNDLKMKGVRELPRDARVVFFHGADDPWAMRVQAEYGWIRTHYA